MQPAAGPIPPAGFTKSAAGALCWKWRCGRCGLLAHNSSKLLELLRTPCGEQGEWRQLLHDPVADAARVSCRRCGTTRQRHVPLGLQRCPVRALWRDGGEVAAGTAAYAAWTAAIKAMHGRAAQPPPPLLCEAALLQPPVPATAAGPAGPEREEPELVPRALTLRPFRSHVAICSAEVEFCMLCFSRAPRFRTAAWRAECCDGTAPVGAAPKHILAAVAVAGGTWPVRHSARGADLKVAAKAWQFSHASKALRPPKRRVPAAARPAAYPNR
jgi:hypothetical protein